MIQYLVTFLILSNVSSHRNSQACLTSSSSATRTYRSRFNRAVIPIFDTRTSVGSVHGLLQRGILQACRESGKLQDTLIGVAGFVGTTFYSRRSRRGLSICILCHKCENRFEFNAFRLFSPRKYMYVHQIREGNGGGSPTKSLLPRLDGHENCIRFLGHVLYHYGLNEPVTNLPSAKSFNNY